MASFSDQWDDSSQSAYVSRWRFDPPKKGASTDINIDAHRGDLEDLVVNKYQSSLENGLTSERHSAFLLRDGPNRLTPPKGTPAIVKFLKQLFGGFALLLWAGAVLCVIAFVISIGQQNIDLNYLYLAVVLSGVVTITAIFSYSQEAKSAAVMEGFKALTEQEALVKRDGNEFKLVPASDLVVGDIVSINGGDKVPADIRIISASSFKVDNSSLTGESDPQSRVPEMTDPNPLETKNLAFFSTSATEGKAIGVVVATGDDTVIGKIAKLASSTSNVQTPINKEIHHFIRIISAIAIILGIVFFIFGLAAGYDIVTNFVFAIGIIVANVPEGLLATVTVALTLTSQRMARKNVLVKNLESVETLGSTTTICSDKTGTLTQNRMTVAHLWYNGQIFDAGANPELQAPDYELENVTFQALLQCASLCNNAVFTDKENELAEGVPIRQLKTNGDASETALLKFAEPVLNGMHSIGSVLAYREQMPTSSDRAIPFNSSNKYQVSVHATGKSDQPWLLVMKGAPERILDRCSHVNVNGAIEPLTEEWKNNYLDSIRQLGENGERVLGFCNMPLDPAKYHKDFEFDREEIGSKYPELDNFHLLGLMSMIDPPRPAVPGAVRTCKTAGIKVIMVTGDYYVTAKAIAKQVNIITSPTVEDVAAELGIPVESVDDRTVDAIVVSGGQLANMTDYELDLVLEKKQIVFARTSPQQKLRIVAGCQRKKQIVAVTGDGVNDSPALKKADIGIAMGITGSDVSQEAADMILLDDNFASIVRGVKEGRLIFDNLKKSIAYTLSSNIPEITPFILFIVLQIPLPLSTVLILAVDLGTDIIPAISLAYEGPESDIMRRKPRDAEVDNLVTTKLISFSYLQIGMIQALAGMYTYFVVMADYGFPASYLLFNNDEFISDDEVAVDGNPPRDEDYRAEVLRHAQTAYFVSIVIVQWADLIICKTRRLSLFQQGMTNWALNFGLCSETVLAIIICYTPGIQLGLGTEPLRFVHWLPALPFSLLIFCYDETRKFWMRRSGRVNFISGWIERNTYY